MNGQIDWVSELKQGLRTAEDLYRAGFIKQRDIPQYQTLIGKYQFLLPRYYAQLIDKSDENCPIRKQAIPSLEEISASSPLVVDPLADLRHQPAPRVTHRYRNRCLIHLTSNCSMYCRFCFRKTLLNDLSEPFFDGNWESALDYVRAHSSIEEVIFSGGDPLMVGDSTISRVVATLPLIPHLKRVRFHTRVPVTFPIRITDSLVSILESIPIPCTIVMHFNHPKELTEVSSGGVTRLRRGKLMLLNQTVLLRGVNDSAPILKDLFEGLFRLGVLPYYLHHPDRARGTEHFDLEIEEGKKILRELKESLPGYLVPRYVVDPGGTAYKTELH